MENNNTKSIVFITLLSTLVIGLGGFIVYDKFIAKDEKEVNVNVDETADKKELAKTMVISGEYADTVVTTVLNNNSVYVNIEITNNSGIYYQEYYGLIKTLSNSYTKFTFDDFEYQGVTSTDNYFYGLKLNITDVKSIYSVSPGQSLWPKNQGIALIKNDGGLAYITFDSISRNNLTPTNIPELKNIVKIENRSGTSLTGGIENFAIDKDGKEFNTDEYFN